MRNQGRLTRDHLEALAREEMRLNEIERLTAHFATFDSSATKH
jgi:hypothetical protein